MPADGRSSPLQALKSRRLARAVGPIRPVRRPAGAAMVTLVQRDGAAEADGEVLDLEAVPGHGAAALRVAGAAARHAAGPAPGCGDCVR